MFRWDQEKVLKKKREGRACKGVKKESLFR